MALPEPYAYFIDPLESLGLTYCITGSVAAGIYGEPRTTYDIDVVLLLSVSELARFQSRFPEEEFYVPPLDSLLTEVRRPQRGMFNLLHHGSGYKADLFLAARDPLHTWALGHRRRKPYDEAFPERDLLWVAPPEYVILRKLEYFRESSHEKHLRDVRYMLDSTPDLDQPFIDSQLARLGLQAQWRIVLEPGEPRFPAT